MPIVHVVEKKPLPPPLPEVEAVTMTLTLEEAGMIRHLVGNVGGSERGWRGVATKIWHALNHPTVAQKAKQIQRCRAEPVYTSVEFKDEK